MSRREREPNGEKRLMIEPLPIETAPEDGTRILLWGGAALDEAFPDQYEPGWHIGYWEGEFWSDDMGRGWIFEATYWMPLRASPMAATPSH
jgi:hypothetical protein